MRTASQKAPERAGAPKQPGAQGLLLDTDVLVEIRRERPEPALVAFLRRRSHRTLYLSVLSLGQVQAVHTGAGTEQWLDELCRRFGAHLLPVSAEVSRRWAGQTILSNPAESGVIGRGARGGDPVLGLIAATAAEHDLTVVSGSAEHYRAWGVPAVDPWE